MGKDLNADRPFAFLALGTFPGQSWWVSRLSQIRGVTHSFFLVW